MNMVIQMILTVFVISVAPGAETEFQVRVVQLGSSADRTPVNRDFLSAEGSTVYLLPLSAVIPAVSPAVPGIAARRIPGAVAIHLSVKLSLPSPLPPDSSASESGGQSFPPGNRES